MNRVLRLAAVAAIATVVFVILGWLRAPDAHSSHERTVGRWSRAGENGPSDLAPPRPHPERSSDVDVRRLGDDTPPSGYARLTLVGDGLALRVEDAEFGDVGFSARGELPPPGDVHLVEPDRVELVIPPERLTAARMRHETSVLLVLRLDNRWRVQVLWQPQSGEDEEVRIDERIGEDTAPLQITGRTAQPSELGARVRVARVRQPARLELVTSDRIQVNAHTTWSRLDGRSEQAEPFRMDDAPLSVELLVSYLRDDGAFAFVEHVHDGSDLDVVLTEGMRICGRTVDRAGRPVPGVEVRVEHARQGIDVTRSWNRSLGSTNADGRFDSPWPRGLPKLTPTSTVHPAFPDHAVLRFLAEGRERADRPFDFTPGARLELGDVVVARKPVTFVIVHDEPLGSEGLQVGWFQGRRMRWAAVERVTQIGPRTSGLVLASVPPGVGDDPPPALLVESRRGVLGCVRDGASYLGQPTTRLETTIETTSLDPFPDFLRVTLRWRGLMCQLGATTRPKSMSLDVRVPASGATLAWNERAGSERPAAVDLGPVAAIPARVELMRPDPRGRGR